ncbi:hypothetical protein ABKP09_19655 [Peribacillus frigoritolerans]|uniref:hypothetical protein n=1 Tax=Peribacillus frigoritolerans TaxID=450367 RepID=UPI0032B388DC
MNSEFDDYLRKKIGLTGIVISWVCMVAWVISAYVYFYKIIDATDQLMEFIGLGNFFLTDLDRFVFNIMLSIIWTIVLYFAVTMSLIIIFNMIPKKKEKQMGN